MEPSRASGAEVVRAAEPGKSSATENEPGTDRARAAEAARYSGLAEALGVENEINPGVYVDSSDAMSSFLAHNPELIPAAPAAANLPEVNQNGIAPYYGLAEYLAAQKDATMVESDSTFLAANPELMAARRYTSK